MEKTGGANGWPDPSKTEELLTRARSGDEDAVNLLFERHRQALVNLVRPRLARKVAQRVDASDVVQDVLVDANRRLAEYLRSPTMPFFIWLRQIASDRMIDVHRRHKLAARRSVDREARPESQASPSSFDLIKHLQDDALTPATAAIRKEIEERFLAALEHLSDDDREVLLMRHFEHLSNGDVATILGLTPATAGMRYLRAIRRLRAVLEGDASAESTP